MRGSGRAGRQAAGVAAAAAMIATVGEYYTLRYAAAGPPAAETCVACWRRKLSSPPLHGRCIDPARVTERRALRSERRHQSQEWLFCALGHGESAMAAVRILGGQACNLARNGRWECSLTVGQAQTRGPMPVAAESAWADQSGLRSPHRSDSIIAPIGFAHLTQMTGWSNVLRVVISAVLPTF